MSFSSNLQNVAISLLTNYGEITQFTRVETSAYNPATSSVISDAPIVFSANSYPGNYTISEIDEVSITRDDIKLIVDSTSEPKVDDTVLVRGIQYRVMDVKRISAQGNNIIYICQVRV